MQVQYTTSCALRMMVYLAADNKIVTSNEMEKKLGFPKQTIFGAGRKLKAAGYVNTISGPFGGYILGKPPEDITLQNILDVFHDSFSTSYGKSPANSATTVTMRNYEQFLAEMEKGITRKLMSCTLADLMKPPDDPG